MLRSGKERTSSTEKLRKKLFESLDEVRGETVIVEGARDKSALMNIGFHDVHTINRNKGLYDISYTFEGEVLVLTDFDPEGEKLAGKLTKYLTKLGCKVKKRKRSQLRRIFLKNDINTIEGIKRISIR